MRCRLIAELASNHGGDLDLAKTLIRACAEAGADIVKTQGYQVKHLRRDDPQYDWLKRCELTDDQHRELMDLAAECGVEYLTTAFHPEDLERLEGIGLTAVKIGSGEGRSGLVRDAVHKFDTVYASLPWGCGETFTGVTWLATVPIYPAPVECYARINKRAGYSDHHVGLDVAKIAIAQGARVLEKHVSLAGHGRNSAWDCEPGELRVLRQWAEVCVQALDGSRYEGRWGREKRVMT